MKKICCADCVKSDEVLHTVKEEDNILQITKRRKAIRIGHILRKKCHLKHATKGHIGGRITATERRGRRS